MPNIEGNRNDIVEHMKQVSDFFGNRGRSQFISGEQGNRYPLGWTHECV